jgi:hypothetical protein
MVDVAVVLVAIKLPNVGVEVATTCPEAFVESSELTATPPSVNVPIFEIVLDEYPNEARVVDVLENVFRAVNTLDVYVLGIVVDE